MTPVIGRGAPGAAAGARGDRRGAGAALHPGPSVRLRTESLVSSALPHRCPSRQPLLLHTTRVTHQTEAPHAVSDSHVWPQGVSHEIVYLPLLLDKMVAHEMISL